ncbi:uncharacterized protein N0V89_011195 [Didymosphaeria variabile]|uniref:Inositol-1-monophosphatase n=1 Tax=Didymosphaeria variabile TaxID=1932322 RepID=A0A9W9C668_9PLEO|nr:uncharacterized protein N0V89_011195 [Didymosphaeria variabile]KAJ4347255.1 hypothetical protein N0V89_011195 [Didymosphaeria variabile]
MSGIDYQRECELPAIISVDSQVTMDLSLAPPVTAQDLDEPICEHTLRDSSVNVRPLNSQTNQTMESLPTPPTTAPNSGPSTPDAQQRLDFLASYGLDEAMLRKIKNDLVDIARTAGQMMIAADPSVVESDTKKNSSDRVTETDKAVEKMVQDRLTSEYPHFGFLGEETFKLGDKLGDMPTFVCDPIDGTLNFIHGFPNTAVSLALTIEKKPFVGVVYNSFRGDLFTAIKWQGAFFTTSTGITRRLPMSPVPKPMTSLNDCLVALEWGSQREGSNWELRTSMSQQLMTSKAAGGAMVHSIRSNGSAALDFCYVAAGMIDVFWEGGCWIWDVCAGWIILEEAGGMVASANPGDWDPTLEGRLYLAVRGAKRAEQEGVVKELWEMMGDRKFVY